MGVMKHFRHILMGHETFFNIFDGPQNIFFMPILVILFSKLRELKHKNIQTSHQGDLRKTRYNSTDIRQVVVKIKIMFDAI